ncbi:unnamed protein product [Rotaria socialis]|uniref:Antistasin-like domain-containing protein n=1 Tax=Rotaria socialis TaxID=392032 RepID=A0A818ZEX5_9BILA|nr:unnamed protein product [Rotaria socialis]CAF3303016.1 unnamed protein product [Rotaria socialis]CAF3606232.1 unnamed protein product [Rotaria socialis]CAF3696423.1 unnamed protein product [Rotaria socialis]CAF3766365.1 unnamed protein product [Rotaria socialis]
MLLQILFAIISLTAEISASAQTGRCPHPQYVSSGLSCSTEGDDSVCPWNYTCCPLTDGMKCFSPCPEFSAPCTLDCPFGLKVDQSPCTVCKCAAHPCLTTTCPLGTKCTLQEYQPCAIKGRCGVTTKCIIDPSIPIDPNSKPKKCPDYWPVMGNGLQACVGADSLCPGEQKCCKAPQMNHFNLQDSPVSYCVQPCEDLSNCTLQCSHGFTIDGGCRICQCAPNPCDTISCPPGQMCQLLPAPCAFYPGRPPCPMFPTCMKRF